MAHTAATLKARFSEFDQVPDARVTADLAAATRRCNASVFGDDLDEAVALLCGHLLACSPFGQQAGIGPDGEGTTTYLAEWRRLARQRAGGPWTVGQEYA